jgi:hypothetical protein
METEKSIFTGIEIPDECAETLARIQREMWERCSEICGKLGEGGGASELHGFNCALTTLGLMPLVTLVGERLQRRFQKAMKP